MDTHKYLGKQASDLPEEVIKQLIEQGYSVSPKSGRIRKRFRYKDDTPYFKRRSTKRKIRIILWILILIIFLIALYMFFSTPTPVKKH